MRTTSDPARWWSQETTDQMLLITVVVWSGVTIPMIVTRDIAAAAAAALRARDWAGVAVRELLGPRDLSHAEIVLILGDRIGRPGLRYMQLPDADLVGALTGAGFSADVAGR